MQCFFLTHIPMYVWCGQFLWTVFGEHAEAPCWLLVSMGAIGLVEWANLVFVMVCGIAVWETWKWETRSAFLTARRANVRRKMGGQEAGKAVKDRRMEWVEVKGCEELEIGLGRA